MSKVNAVVKDLRITKVDKYYKSIFNIRSVLSRGTRYRYVISSLLKLTRKETIWVRNFLSYAVIYHILKVFNIEFYLRPTLLYGKKNGRTIF